MAIRTTLAAKWRLRHTQFGRLQPPTDRDGPDDRPPPTSSPFSRRADAVDQGEPVEVSGSEIGRRDDMDVDFHARYLIGADGSIRTVSRG